MFTFPLRFHRCLQNQFMEFATSYCRILFLLSASCLFSILHSTFPAVQKHRYYITFSYFCYWPNIFVIIHSRIEAAYIMVQWQLTQWVKRKKFLKAKITQKIFGTWLLSSKSHAIFTLHPVIITSIAFIWRIISLMKTRFKNYRKTLAHKNLQNFTQNVQRKYPTSSTAFLLIMENI